MQSYPQAAMVITACGIPNMRYARLKTDVGSLYKKYGLSKSLAEKIFSTDEGTRTYHHFSSREAQHVCIIAQSGYGIGPDILSCH